VGQFANSANHKCDPCDSSCQTCSVIATRCLTCSSGFNCTICDLKCLTCNGSPTNCSVCASGAYLFNNTCFSSCPTSFYNDDNGGAGPNICKKCDVSCVTCTGPGNTNCPSCVAFYRQSGTTCSTSCMPGYGYTYSFICVICVSPCVTCQIIGTNCLSCISTPNQYYLLPSFYTSCVESCPTTHYLNSLTCVKCPSTCMTCNNGSSCDVCISNALFYNNFCYMTCPPGSYKFN
jgi:proprotein convertase subtilisin/kexin type 5